MLRASLTSKRATLGDGSTAFEYAWNGETVLVRDNAENALEVWGLFNDAEADEGAKATRIIERLFADPDDAFCACDFSLAEFGRLVNAVVWDVFGIDNQGGRGEEPLWDPDEDAELVRASLRMAYSVEWDEARAVMTWSEFVSLVASLPYDTPLGMRMHYRNRANRPKPTKHNREQVEEFDRLHRLFALRKINRGSHDRAEASNSAMNDLALALNARTG